MKAWKRGEEKYCVLKLSQGLAVVLLLGKKDEAVGGVWSFKVNAKMLAVHRQRYMAYKENTVSLRFSVKEMYINNAYG